MASEAVIVELQSGMNAIDQTVADGVGISKGALLAQTDPRTAASSTTREAFAGIAVADKEADDGALNLGSHQTGIFDLRATSGAAIAAGEKVILSGANLVTGINVMGEFADKALSAGYVVGTALEGTAAGTAETIEVDIGRR